MIVVNVVGGRAVVRRSIGQREHAEYLSQHGEWVRHHDGTEPPPELLLPMFQEADPGLLR